MTDKKTQALKLALEALTPLTINAELRGDNFPKGNEIHKMADMGWKAITAIREALASEANEQPAQRCPLCNYQHGHAIGCENNPVDIALAKMAEQPAQQQEPVTVLPDGSAFAVMSYPLPKNHWLYAERQYNDGEDEPVELGKPVLTHEMRDAVVSAVRYAVRGATNCGKEVDFDPDALVQNAVYALCGPFTSPQPAQQQEPIAKVCHDLDGHIGWNPKLTQLPDEGTPLYAPPLTQQEPVAWYESMAELAAVYGEMCAINETPSKDQTQEQKDRLRVLRAECVAIHYRRIAMNTSPPASKLWVQATTWRGLTDEERNHARQSVTYSQLAMTAGEWTEAVQIETERRLREKNARE
jgi:hypothetical protein